MKWKIFIKVVYLITLLAIAALEWKEESKLIDSDPTKDKRMYQATLSE